MDTDAGLTVNAIQPSDSPDYYRQAVGELGTVLSDNAETIRLSFQHCCRLEVHILLTDYQNRTDNSRL